MTFLPFCVPTLLQILIVMEQKFYKMPIWHLDFHSFLHCLFMLGYAGRLSITGTTSHSPIGLTTNECTERERWPGRTQITYAPGKGV